MRGSKGHINLQGQKTSNLHNLYTRVWDSYRSKGVIGGSRFPPPPPVNTRSKADL